MSPEDGLNIYPWKFLLSLNPCLAPLGEHIFNSLMQKHCWKLCHREHHPFFVPLDTGDAFKNVLWKDSGQRTKVKKMPRYLVG